MEQKDNHNMDDAMIKSELIPQFVASLEESIRRNYEMDVTVEKSTTLKTNMEADIFVVHFKDSNIAPTIYLNDILNYHRNGMSIEVISEEMSKAVVRAYWNSPVLPKFTAEEAKKSITLTLINAEKNKKLLQNVPHFLVGDVAAIPRWYLSDNTSFVVTNDMAGKTVIATLSATVAEEKTASVIFALFDTASNKLVACSVKPATLATGENTVSSDVFTVPSDEGKTYELKAFVWTTDISGENTMTPVFSAPIYSNNN